MKNNKYIVYLILMALLICMLGVGGALVFKIRQKQKAKWWVENRYPLVWNLVDQSKVYYKSYDDWQQAGQAITGIDPILAGLFNETNDEKEQLDLLLAMGAIAGPKSIACLIDVVKHSKISHLKRTAFEFGLVPNAKRPVVQEVLFQLACNPKEDTGLVRAVALIALLKHQNKLATDYAKKHGEEIIQQLNAANTSPQYITLCEKTFGVGETKTAKHSNWQREEVASFQLAGKWELMSVIMGTTGLGGASRFARWKAGSTILFTDNGLFLNPNESDMFPISFDDGKYTSAGGDCQYKTSGQHIFFGGLSGYTRYKIAYYEHGWLILVPDTKHFAGGCMIILKKPNTLKMKKRINTNGIADFYFSPK